MRSPSGAKPPGGRSNSLRLIAAHGLINSENFREGKTLVGTTSQCHPGGCGNFPGPQFPPKAAVFECLENVWMSLETIGRGERI
jgi:hypothetical protein